MASILDSLTQLFTPDVTRGISKTTGLDGNLLGSGLAVVGPLVLGAMAKRAATPNGLDVLSRLIPQDGGVGLNNVLGLVTDGGAQPAALGGLFGPGLSAINGTIDRKLGFRASALIPLVTPLILGLLSKRKAAEKLDPNGLARVLKDETQAFLDKGGEPVSVIRSALDAGDKAAEYKSQFTPQEWTQLRLAPLAAARLVVQASPSGAVGSMKEAGAAGQTIAVARASSDPASLISLAYDTDLTREEADGLGTDRSATLKVIKEALVALAHRSPSDVPAYAQFIHTLALKVAEETREGGFLGLGGTRISREEQAVLDEIDTLTGALA